MESLLCASTKTGQAMRVGQGINNLLDFDERGRPVVAEEQGDSVFVLGTLVHEVDAQRL
jgi:hypothetical protein